MRRNGFRALIVAGALLGASSVADAANLLPAVQYFSLETTGGVLNPGVLVGFNPQPDPPGLPPTSLDLRDPMRPLFDQPSGNSYIVSVSLFPGTPSLLLPAVQAPDRDGLTQVSFCDGSVRVTCDGSVFVLSLEFQGLGGIVHSGPRSTPSRSRRVARTSSETSSPIKSLSAETRALPSRSQKTESP